MRQLLLLRHAKSSWADPGMRDIERPLNSRGREAAPRMAHYIKAAGYEPDQIICSSARRTRETLALLLPAFSGAAQIEISPALYDADEAEYRRIIKTHGTGSRLMLIGHNTSIEDLAMALASNADGPERARIEEKYPTCGLAVFEVSAPWADIGPHNAQLTGFVTPAMLTLDNRS